MIAMDTDHLSVFAFAESAQHQVLSSKIRQATALTQDALLLSANLRDFRQVPGLRVENWLQ